MQRIMSSDPLKQYYEDSSHRYWDPRQGMVGRDLHIYPLLKGLSGTVLEYGCGAGSLLLALAKEDRFDRCIGVDISENVLSMVKQAWRDFGHVDANKVTVMAPDDDRLPGLPDKSADVLLSLDTIEHVVNPYVVIDELHRVARDNAVFIISVPNYAYIKYVINLLFGKQPRTGTNDPVENWRNVGWDGMHLHTFTRSSLAILLRDCGWEPLRWSGYGERLGWLGLGSLRRSFPGFWSGAITAVCRKVPHPVPLPDRRGPANLPAVGSQPKTHSRD